MEELQRKSMCFSVTISFDNEFSAKGIRIHQCDYFIENTKEL